MSGNKCVVKHCCTDTKVSFTRLAHLTSKYVAHSVKCLTSLVYAMLFGVQNQTGKHQKHVTTKRATQQLSSEGFNKQGCT